MSSSITDVTGIRIGHAENHEARTGCTVILPPATATMAGISVRGAAPATRETDLLHVDGITREIHAVLLTGGSAYGLSAATGVMDWLERNSIGFDAGVARVPLVPTVSLFDLAAGSADIRPDPEMGFTACENASDSPVTEGSVGAGCGATVGKILGMENCSDSGIGSVSVNTGQVTVGVIAVSNAFGDVKTPDGKIVAGAKNPESESFINTSAYLRSEGGLPAGDPFANCTFAVVAVDMTLDRRSAHRIAEMASSGISRAVSPAHSMFDYDVVIALGCGTQRGDIHAVGAAAAELVQESIIRGVRAADAH